MSKPHSLNGSESEFEFIETPKAPTPSFEKFEDCGVKTTSVSLLSAPSFTQTYACIRVQFMAIFGQLARYVLHLTAC